MVAAINLVVSYLLRVFNFDMLLFFHTFYIRHILQASNFFLLFLCYDFEYLCFELQQYIHTGISHFLFSPYFTEFWQINFLT